MKWESPAPPDPFDGADDATEREPIESLLKRMPLRKPAGRLDVRVSRALACGRQRPRLTAFKAAAAAAVIIGTASLMLHRHRTDSPSGISLNDSGARAHPVAGIAERRLRVERDAQRLWGGGIIGFQGGVPMRGYRYQAVRQIWYFDPQHKTRLAVTVPQEQFVLVPIRTF